MVHMGIQPIALNKNVTQKFWTPKTPLFSFSSTLVFTTKKISAKKRKKKELGEAGWPNWAKPTYHPRRAALSLAC